MAITDAESGKARVHRVQVNRSVGEYLGMEKPKAHVARRSTSSPRVKYYAPNLIEVVWVLGAILLGVVGVAQVIVSVVDNLGPMSFALGFSVPLVGIPILRIWCERVLVTFEIRDHLIKIASRD